MAHGSFSTMSYQTTSSDGCSDLRKLFEDFRTDSDCRDTMQSLSQPVVPGNSLSLSADIESSDLYLIDSTETAEVSHAKAVAMPQLSATDAPPPPPAAAAAADPSLSGEPVFLFGRAPRGKAGQSSASKMASAKKQGQKTKQLEQQQRHTSKKLKKQTPKKKQTAKKRQNRKQKEGPRPIDSLRRMCYGIRSLLFQRPMWRQLFKKHPKCRNGVCEKCCYTFLLQALGDIAMLPTDAEIEGNRVVEYLARVMSCKAGVMVEPLALAGGFVQGTAARPGQSYNINKNDVERLCGIKPWEWDVPLFSTGQAK